MFKPNNLVVPVIDILSKVAAVLIDCKCRAALQLLLSEAGLAQKVVLVFALVKFMFLSVIDAQVTNSAPRLAILLIVPPLPAVVPVPNI